MGFFSKKKDEPQPPQEEEVDGPSGQPGEPLMAIVLLAGKTFPFAGMQKLIASTPIAGETATDVKLDQENVLTFMVGDDLVAMALMPAPYPDGDLEGPIETSWMWPEGTSAECVKAHQTFLLITMIKGQATPVERLLRLTAVTAMAARSRDALGIFWPQAMMIHSPKLFMEMAKEINTPEAPPVLLWIDYRVGRSDDGRTALFTTGFNELGHMDIEIPSIDMDPGELREWCVNMTYYLLENGPVFLHGQTVGMTAEQKIKITHSPSVFGKTRTVIRLTP